MKIYSKNIKVISGAFMLLSMASMIGSCNKALPDALPIVYPPINSSTTSIGTLINTDTTYSYYKAAATKAGMLAQLSDSTKLFTVFLPNNAAFRASGIPSVAVVNSLPPASLGGIVGYSIIPGNQYTSDIIPTSFPNIQLPSS
ncbi:MAG TPA: fasciclin domain-containing protein, partial [Hanamia sp.]|nr:fasciclin domain-containing protein [Hanamia sp.]